jgi:endonuclease/exonuclease/phosphatase family metal-dependent hydrolase
MFKTNRRRMICINTHLDFDTSVQVQSARLILDRLSQLPGDIPVILMGDFNAAPFSPCYDIFTGNDDQPAVKTSCFKDAFEQPYTGTHHGFTGHSDGDQIDWILFRGKIAVKHSRVIRNTFNRIYISDHFPLYAEFKWED